jgi:hypothetical protein
MELMIARASDIYIGASTVVVKNKSVHLNRAMSRQEFGCNCFCYHVGFKFYHSTNKMVFMEQI